jgi:hypothetical protein
MNCKDSLKELHRLAKGADKKPVENAKPTARAVAQHRPVR